MIRSLHPITAAVKNRRGPTKLGLTGCDLRVAIRRHRFGIAARIGKSGGTVRTVHMKHEGYIRINADYTT